MIGNLHTAIMDAIHGELMRQKPGAFTEEDGNSTLAIPVSTPFLTLDVSSLAEVVLPLAAPSPAAPEGVDEIELFRVIRSAGRSNVAKTKAVMAYLADGGR